MRRHRSVIRPERGAVFMNESDMIRHAPTYAALVLGSDSFRLLVAATATACRWRWTVSMCRCAWPPASMRAAA
jgi:hypothetical protein